jgi:hypothetical protein
MVLTTRKNGYVALLGLLIVIAIAMLIYFLEAKTIFGPGRKYANRPVKPEDHPWQMENLLMPEDQIVPVPKKGQPEFWNPLNSPLLCSATTLGEAPSI